MRGRTLFAALAVGLLPGLAQAEEASVRFYINAPAGINFMLLVGDTLSSAGMPEGQPRFFVPPLSLQGSDGNNYGYVVDVEVDQMGEAKWACLAFIDVRGAGAPCITKMDSETLLYSFSDIVIPKELLGTN